MLAESEYIATVHLPFNPKIQLDLQACPGKIMHGPREEQQSKMI